MLLSLLGLYLLVVAAAYVFQRRFIYFPHRLADLGRAGGAPGEAFVSFPSEDGARLSAIYVPPPSPEALVALVAHGNAGNASTWRPYLEPFLEAGVGALLLDPRGYGASAGSPSEAGWHADGAAALAWLGAQGVAPERVVLVGVSIGSGIAVPLAARAPVRGLILEGAFTSLADMAQAHYPFLPCGLLLKDRYDNLAAAPRVTCPVLLLHGVEDRIVPAPHAERLARAFPTPPTLHQVPGFGHNDLGLWPAYASTLRTFLHRLEGVRPR